MCLARLHNLWPTLSKHKKHLQRLPCKVDCIHSSIYKANLTRLRRLQLSCKGKRLVFTFPPVSTLDCIKIAWHKPSVGSNLRNTELSWRQNIAPTVVGKSKSCIMKTVLWKNRSWDSLRVSCRLNLAVKLPRCYNSSFSTKIIKIKNNSNWCQQAN